MPDFKRDRWKSNYTFLFAAIGSTVGLGNIWRFPYLAYQYGGGSFLFPYLTLLFFLGIPLLLLEMALGQKLQKGAVEAFRTIHPRLSAIGFLAVITSFIIVIYYAIIMAWIVFYLFYSFSAKLPWEGSPKTYFFYQVLELSESFEEMGAVSGPLLLALFFIWLSIYMCIRKGVRSVGKVVMITVPLPLILLIILFLRAVTLEGSWNGIYHYIYPNFYLLFKAEIWIAAASQVFFTLSLATGIMIAYSSFNKPNCNILKNGLTIAFSDALISIFSGFVVFSIVGYMAHETGQSVQEVATSGPGLAFIVFPKAISMMPWWPNFFSILFFLTLLTLGIDSVFSLVESLMVVLCDHLHEIRREEIAFWVCALCFALGFIFTTEAGLYYLKLIDHFTINILLVLVGILESLAIAWFLGIERVRCYINRLSKYKISEKWNYVIKYFIPLTMGSLLILHIKEEISRNYHNFPDWAIKIGWATVLIPILLSLKMAFFPNKRKVEESFNNNTDS